MRHDPRTRRVMVTATASMLAVMLAGCSHRSNEATSSTTTLSSSVVTIEPGTGPVPRSSGPDSTVPTPSSLSTSPSGSTSPSAAAPQASPVVEVSGGSLPSAISKAYDANGGDMVDPTEWERRYGPGPIPVVSGDGVVLVEALRRFEQSSSGWVRTDEASWLATSNEDRDAVIAKMAAATGATGKPTRTEMNEPGANCVVDKYPTVDDVAWQVQGCSYEQFPQFIAVGVSRSGPTTDAPTTVDPTVATLADVADGKVVFTEIHLGEPGSDGSTLRLSTQMETSAKSDVAATLAAGPLSGWQKFPGESSMMLSGPTGATWSIGDNVAVFNWAGRW